jgi:hypothetical protein
MVRRMNTHVLVAHHGYCFDGASSAAIFTRFLRDIDPESAGAEFQYRALLYEPNAPPPGDKLKPGAVNAILDYRYSMSDQLTWYFDHHVSAFQEPGSEAHFRRDASGRKYHDGTYGSCTRFIADVARARYGWEAPDLGELIEWSDVIDAARFADADAASSFDAPAMAVAAVIQEQGDDNLNAQLIPLLASKTLAEVAAHPQVVARLAPIKTRHEALTRRMEQAGEQRANVALFDLSDQPLETVAKFVGYKLFPTAMYSVVLSRTPRRVKISVGFNPWSKKPRTHSIAALCEKYGGGGHPVVGAISLPAGDLARAKGIVEEIVRALNA